MSDVPFNVLMQQAAALKTSQLATERRKFDAHDEWYRNSLFARQTTRDVREADDGESIEGFKKRIDYARECKQKGNELFGRGDYTNAIYEYEQSLAVFEYIHPLDANWKKKGIEDRNLEERRYTPPSAEAKAEIDALKLSNILNLSLSYLKARQWSNCIAAATSALELDPKNTKALYRRAQARILPASCGTVDNQLALEDLHAAYLLKPEDATLQTAYAELRVQLAEQRSKDKKQYNNLFNRNVDVDQLPSDGSEHDKDQHSKQPLTWKDAFIALKDMETAAASYERDGDIVQAKEMSRKIVSLQQQIDQHFPVAAERDRLAAAAVAAGRDVDASERTKTTNQFSSETAFGTDIDFSDPTPEMIADAQQRGLDITDARVQRIMQEISTLRKRDTEQHKQKESLNSDSGAHRRVEHYLQEATRNIYREEAEHIAETLLSDVSETEMRQMLVSRMQYQQMMAESSMSSQKLNSDDSSMGLYEWSMQHLAKALGIKLPPRVNLPEGKDRLEVMKQLKDCITNDVVDLRLARDRAQDALRKCNGDQGGVSIPSNEAVSDSVVAMLEERYGVGASTQPNSFQLLLRVFGIGRKGSVRSLAFVMAFLTCLLLVMLRFRGSISSRGGIRDESNDAPSPYHQISGEEEFL